MVNFNFSNDPTTPSRLPRVDSSDAETLDWIEAAAQEARGFLVAQKGYEKIEPTMNQILSADVPLRPEKLSTTAINETGKIAAVLAALVTDIKPFWDYRTLNPNFEDHVRIANRLAESWYRDRSIDQKNAAVAKYSLAAGSGYGHLVWSKDMQDIDLIAEDPRDVLPIRPASVSASLQDAMGVMVVRELPVARVEAMFPWVPKGRIKPDRDGAAPSSVDTSTRVGKIMRKLNLSAFEIWLNARTDAAKKSKGRYPVVDLYYTYLNDVSRNKGKQPLQVGQFDPDGTPANNWSYLAHPGDLIYPRKRLIISCSSMVIYDGPSFYWHGMFPISKLTLDSWPWSYLGKSPLWDLEPMQKSLDKILRFIDDRIQVMARPPVEGDRNSVSRAELLKFDPSQPGQQVHHSMIGGGFKIHEIQPIDPAIIAQRDYLQQRMYHISGVQDMTQLLNLNQMPGDNTIETLLAAMSPDLRGRSRAIEAYMTEIATMLAYNFAQFYTLPRRLAILGPSGQTIDDWDFDPETFVPAYMPSDFDGTGALREDRLNNSRPRFDRARELMRHLTFYTKPGSLLESAASSEKMLYIQLARMGYIDIWTLGEKLGIPNMGIPPQGTIVERLQQQAQMLMGMDVGPAGASSAGRKASGQEPPEMRPDGYISESG